MTANREPRPARRPALGVVRRAAVLAGVALLALVGTAGPAAADAPLGWDPAKEAVPGSHVLWIALAILGGIVLIAAAIYLPAIARGEDVRPGADHAEDAEWFGGPRKAPAELAAADTDTSQAGGASGRW